MHTTNYQDTFIEIADDTKVNCGTIPGLKGGHKTMAGWQYELIAKNPYRFTSDDILFQVFAIRNDLTEQEQTKAREMFFSKGQACLRASALTKTHGFGIHSDNHGRVALYGMETEQYENFIKDPKVKKVKAMRTSKK